MRAFVTLALAALSVDPDEFADSFMYHWWLCGGFPSSVTDEDTDGDGLASPKEFYSNVQQPDMFYPSA